MFIIWILSSLKTKKLGRANYFEMQFEFDRFKFVRGENCSLFRYLNFVVKISGRPHLFLDVCLISGVYRKFKTPQNWKILFTSTQGHIIFMVLNFSKFSKFSQQSYFERFINIQWIFIGFCCTVGSLIEIQCADGRLSTVKYGDCTTVSPSISIIYAV